jgi:hypothetical protein
MNLQLYVSEQAAIQEKKFAENVYKKEASQFKDSEVTSEENEDWKFVQITLVAIESLPKYCHQAFGYTKALNQI